MARRRRDGSYQAHLPLFTQDEKARVRGWTDAGKAGLTLADNPYVYGRPGREWALGFKARRRELCRGSLGRSGLFSFEGGEK